MRPEVTTSTAAAVQNASVFACDKRDSRRRSSDCSSTRSILRSSMKTACARAVEGMKPLEARIMLAGTPANVIASFDGTLGTGQTTQLPIHITQADFPTTRIGGTILGFHLSAGEGSNLNPAAAQLRDAQGQLVSPLYVRSDLGGTLQSLSLVSLPYGDYSIDLTSEKASTGAWHLEVYLVGDVTGDHGDTAADTTALSGVYGSHAGQAAYKVEADADLNGQIDSTDAALQIKNIGSASTINALTLAAQLSPLPTQSTAEGTPLTSNPDSGIQGTTSPGATVSLDLDGDGVFDQTAVVDPGSGAFSFSKLTLAEGLNTFTVKSEDHFGQSRLLTLKVVLDTSVVLSEQSSFRVADQRAVIVPGEAAKLRFFFKDPSFDSTDHFVNDAFEVALVDGDGDPLVYPIAGQHDAVFNLTEKSGLSKGPQASSPSAPDSQGWRSVDLDVSSLPAGTRGTLVLRLVNNDRDTQSSVRVGQVYFVDAAGKAITSWQGANPPADINGDGKVDFADLVAIAQNYGKAGDRATGDLNGDGRVDFGDLVLVAQQYNQVVGKGYVQPHHLVDSSNASGGIAASGGSASGNGGSAGGAGTVQTVQHGPVSVSNTNDLVKVTATAPNGQVAAGTSVLISGKAMTNSIETASVFSDSDFASGDWTLAVPQIYSGGTISAVQADAGGNPGAFRSVTNTVTDSYIYGIHLKTSAVYDPSLLGPITSLDYAEDSIILDGFGEGETSGAALLQDGKLYMAFNGNFPTPDFNWTHHTVLGMTASDFALVGSTFDRSQHPDFSAHGKPITFGFVRANSSPSGGYTIVGAIDNWSVTAHHTLPNTIANVTVNGQPVEALDTEGNFYFHASIHPGQDVFDIVATDSSGASATVALPIVGTSNTSTTSLVDLSGSLSAQFGRTSFNQDSGVLYTQVAAVNTGQFAVNKPLLVGITHISDPNVRVFAPDGYTDSGIPYFDYSSLVSGNRFNPGDVTQMRELSFFNPNQVQFTFDLVPLGQLNQPPHFTSTPKIEATAGKAYSYQATAMDPDGDPLTYSLLSGPAGMTVNPVTGLLSWSPAAGDVGSHSIALRVSDGRGGTAEQDYQIAVIAAPANRPPVFVTTPVVEATYSKSADDGRILWPFEQGGNGHSYKAVLVPDGVSWDQAKADAEAMGGHLATISSAAENDFVFSLVSSSSAFWHNAGFNTAGPWIGGFQPAGSAEPAADFQWITGEPFTFTNWAPGEPNNGGVPGGNEDAILYWGEGNNTIDKKWNDGARTGFASVAYIVEFDSATYSYPAKAVDPDQDSLSYSLLQAPTGMTVNPQTGQVLWAPTVADLNRVDVQTDSSLPAIPGFIVSTYASVPAPEQIVFDELGNLFAGRDDFSVNMQGGGPPAYISRVLRGSSTGTTYGNTPASDGDAVLVDPDGRFSGVPGAVLVGEGDYSAANMGQIAVILPDGSVRTLIGPSTLLGNVNKLIWDASRNRILYMNGDLVGAVSPGGSPTVLINRSTGFIAVNAQGQIAATLPGGGIALYSPDGTLINPALASDHFGDVEFGPGGVWGTDLYANDKDLGKLVRISASGVVTPLCSIPDRSVGITFGPDGALYIADAGNQRVLRIAPTRQTLGLQRNQYPVTILASDGRGGVAKQSYVINLQSDPANHPPVIVSTPVTTYTVPAHQYATFSHSTDTISVSGNTILGTQVTYEAVIRPSEDFGQLIWNEWQPSGEDKQFGLGQSGGIYGYADLGNSSSGLSGGSSNAGTWHDYAYVYDGAEERVYIDGNLVASRAGSADVPDASSSIMAIGAIFRNGQNGNPIYPSFLGDIDSLRISNSARYSGTHYAPIMGDFSSDSSTVLLFNFDQASGTTVINDESGNGHVGTLGSGFATATSPSFSPAGSSPAYSYKVDAIDLEADPLSYTLIQNPAGMTIDKSTGLIHWTPNITDTGSHVVSVQVSDGRGGADSQTYTLTVRPAGTGDIHGSVFNDLNGDGDEAGSLLDVQLNLSSLPSAQGWNYDSLNSSLAEQQAFGLADGVLHMNTLGQGFQGQGHNYYYFPIQPHNDSRSWELDFRARVTQYESSYADPAFNPFGFFVGVGLGNVGIDISLAGLTKLGAASGTAPGTVVISADTTQWHEYRFAVDSKADAYSFYIDGVLQSSGMFSSLVGIIPGDYGVFFGDGTAGENATADLASLHYFQLPDPSDETGLSHWALYLDQNHNGHLDPAEPSALTDSSGNYSFTDIPAGNYDVREVPQDGWRQTAPASKSYTVTVNPGDVVSGIDFGNESDPSAHTGGAISGHKFDDSNGNQKFDVIADSAADFSSTQGLNGWSYGWFDVTHDADSTYEPADFQLMTDFEGDTWSVQSGTYWTSLWATGGHGNGTFAVGRSSGQQWAVRRWTSTIEGTVSLVGDLHKVGDPGGDGVIGHIFVNGTEVWSEAVDGSGLETIPVDLSISVHKGDVIDFAIDPKPSGDSLRDSTEFKVQITERPLSGWMIYLDQNHNGHLDAGEASAVTDASGSYSFTDLPDGTYTVAEQMQSGWQPTTPAPYTHTVTIAGGNIVTGVDFGNQPITPANPNHDPIFLSTAPTSATAGALLRYDASAFDADGDTLTFDLPLKPDGMAVDPATGTLVWTPRSNQLGPQQVVLRVSDGHGGIATQAFTINVIANHPPVIISTPSTQAVVSFPYRYDVVAIDPDNDPITYGLEAGPVGMTIDPSSGRIDWTPQPAVFKDGLPTPVVGGPYAGTEDEMLVLNPPNGQTDQNYGARENFEVGVNDVGQLRHNLIRFDVTALAGQISSISSVILRLHISSGGLSHAGVDVEGADTVQIYRVAAADAGWIEGSGTSANIGDPSDVGQTTWAQRILGSSNWAGSAGASTPGVDYLTQLVASATFDNTTGSGSTLDFVFTDPSFLADWIAGNNSGLFIRTASQTTGNVISFFSRNSPDPSVRPELIVKYEPIIPRVEMVTVSATDSHGAQALQTFDLHVVANAPNNPPVIASTPRTRVRFGTPFVYSVLANDPDGDPLTYSLTTAPAGMSISPAGIITWTPANNQLGDAPVVVSVSDGRGGLATQSFTLKVLSSASNVAPQIISTPKLAALVGKTYAYDAIASDDDGDGVTWSLVSGPSGLSIDSASGKLRWTPTADQLGSQSITIRASDPYGALADQTFSVQVTSINAPPLILSTPPVNASAGQKYSYAVAATDPEGDNLTFSLTLNPAGMKIDPATGLITWTPTSAQVGTQTVTIHVEDGQGGSVEQAYNLVVSVELFNHPPVITSTPALFGTPDQAYHYTAAAFDPEGDVIKYSLLNPPAGMSIDPDSGVITWTPTTAQSGSQSVTVLAADPSGAAASQHFVVQVKGNSAPRITSTPSPFATARLKYSYDAHASDPDGDPLNYSLTSAPAGASIDNYGRITWLPGSSDVGHPAHFVLLVSDPHGASDTQSFDLTVQGDTQPPKVTLVESNSLINVGEKVRFQVFASDNVGVTSLTLTVGGVTIPLASDGTASFTGVSSALLDVIATASDAAGNSVSAKQQLRVINPADTHSPEVSITSPAMDAEVTYLTDVTGTIQDDNLEFWRVEYARADKIDLDNFAADNPAWVKIGAGTQSVNNAKLATFDPTILSNDSYVIRVYAQDTDGHIVTKGVIVAITGNAKLGQFSQTVTDLSIPLAGISITIQRTYNSFEAANSGDFGFGWKLQGADADIRETVQPGSTFVQNTRVFLTTPDGRRIGFTFKPTPNISFFGLVFLPHFTPDPGVTEQLDTPSDDNTPLILASDGTFSDQLGSTFNPSHYVLTIKDGTEYDYDQSKGLQKVTDLSGNTITFSDDGIQSSTGVGIQFVRDPKGRIKQIIDPDGKAITYVYNVKGELESVTDQAGNKTQYKYLITPAHYLNETIDPLGHPAQKTIFDDSGRVIDIIDANGNHHQQHFDPGSFTGTITDANGNVTDLVYDARGNILQKIQPAPTPGADRPTTTYEYADPRNPDKETKVTDPLGDITRYTYDDRGNVLTITDAMGGVTTYTYDSGNRVIGITDPLGHVTTNSYDAIGHLIATANALGNIKHFRYDDQGRLLSSTDYNGNETQYAYTFGANPTKITNPDGSVREVEYNQYGQVSQLTSEIGIVSRFTYDDLGRVRTQVDNLGNSFNESYEANSNIASATDALGNITQFKYDQLNRLIQETDAQGGTTNYTYDPNGNRTSLTDPDGNTTKWIYDALNRPIQEIDPLGHSMYYQYDLAGNQTAITDRSGRRRIYEYDGLNRLVLETWLGADGTAVIRSIASTYDADGNLVAITDPDSSYAYTYDALNRVIKIDNRGTPNAPHVVLSYAYDRNGNQVLVSDNSGVEVASAYDSRNRLIRRSWSGGGIAEARVDFTYCICGQISSMTRYADVAGTILIATTTYTYDGDDRTQSIVTRNALDVILNSSSYEYDADGRLKRELENGAIAEYSYDSLGQLTDVVRTNSVMPDEHYRYDANGNRLSSSGSINVLGQGNQLLSDGVSSYTYDADGNLLSKTVVATGEVTTYSWDYQGRMIQATERNASGAVVTDVKYTYDANGQLIGRDVDGAATFVSYNGAEEWAQYDAAGAVSLRYLYGKNVDQEVASQGGNMPLRFTLTERLDSVVAQVDAAGNVVSRVSYSAFGVANRSGVSTMDLHAYVGLPFDPVVGMQLNRARLYAATSGQFISRDPIGFSGGDANLYRYVGNSPLNATDPSGNSIAVDYVLETVGDFVGKYLRIRALGSYVVTAVACTGAVYFSTQIPPITLANRDRVERLNKQLNSYLFDCLLALGGSYVAYNSPEHLIGAFISLAALIKELAENGG